MNGALGEQWYVAIDGVVSGPFDTATVRSMALSGTLRDDGAVVPAGAGEWVGVGVAAPRLGLQRDPWGRLTAAAPSSPPFALTPGGPLPPPVPGWSPYPGATYAGPSQVGTARASYGRRAAAWIIDVLLQAFIAAPLLPLLGVEVSGDLGAIPEVPATAAVLVLVVWVLYGGLFHGARGQTPGKMLLRIRVVDVDGQRLGYGRAFVRTATAVLLLNLFYLPGILDMLWPLWDEQRQSLHDKAGRSIVIPAERTR